MLSRRAASAASLARDAADGRTGSTAAAAVRDTPEIYSAPETVLETRSAPRSEVYPAVGSTSVAESRCTWRWRAVSVGRCTP